jgi:5-methylcytosine-specific restriction protein A
MKSEGLVTSVAEVRDNLSTMARYASGNTDEREFHRGRIKNGKNFVAEKVAPQWRFAPSKFVGYAANDTSHMRKLDDRDGGITNKRLVQLLGAPLEHGDPRYAEVDAAYLDYVASFGFEASRHHQGRKYWLIG